MEPFQRHPVIAYFVDEHGQACQYEEGRLPQASTRRKVENASHPVRPLRFVPTRPAAVMGASRPE